MGYLDLHAHVLAALDDGAPDDATGLTMLRTLAQVGYEVVTATPHQKADQYLPGADEIAAAHARLRAQPLPVTLGLAAENFWDDVFFQRWREGSIPGYEGGRAFLFEIAPADTPVRFEETLFEMRLGGRLPVMAHPERVVPLRDDLGRLERLGRQVALLVDLGAVAGAHGFFTGRAARRMLKEGLAHAVASDVHAVADVRSAAQGIAWIRRKLGPGAERRLLEDNPRAILTGELPDP